MQEMPGKKLNRRQGPVITSDNAQTMLLGNAVVEMIESVAKEDEKK